MSPLPGTEPAPSAPAITPRAVAFSELESLVGETLGTSSWPEITQEKIDQSRRARACAAR